MGRVLVSSQTIGTASPYSFAYTYDLSGALVSTTYPSGRTVGNTFDGAGRICNVGSTANGSCAGTARYAENVLYAPQGLTASLGTQLLNPGWGYAADPTANNGNVMSATIQRSSGLPLISARKYRGRHKGW